MKGEIFRVVVSTTNTYSYGSNSRTWTRTFEYFVFSDSETEASELGEQLARKSRKWGTSTFDQTPIEWGEVKVMVNKFDPANFLIMRRVTGTDDFIVPYRRIRLHSATGKPRLVVQVET